MFLSRTVILSLSICAILVPPCVHVNGQPTNFTSLFSWETIFDDSFVAEDFQFNPHIILVQSFVTDFGRSLDECNEKIEEAAIVSKQVVKNFVDKLFNKNCSNEADSLDNISFDNVDFKATISKISESENVHHQERSQNGAMWDYLRDILIVLQDACEDLPNEIQYLNTDVEEAPMEDMSEVLQSILEVMTRWAIKWTAQMQDSASLFIESCVEDVVCEGNLKVIVEIVRDALENDANFPESLAETNSISPFGSPMFWEAFSSRESLGSGGATDVNSFLRQKLQQMTGVLSHFASHQTTEPQESSTMESSPEDKDQLRVRKLVTAAVNVMRYPWAAGAENTAVLAVTGRGGRVPPTFLSVAAGVWRMAGERAPPLQSPLLRTLLAPLGPVVLRVGGTSVNLMSYQREKSPEILNNDVTSGMRTSSQNNFVNLKQSATANHPKLRRKRDGQVTHPKLRRKRDVAVTHTKLRSPDLGDCDHCKGGPNHMTNFTLTESELTNLLDLCADLNWTLLFDLNQLKRLPNGDWNSTEARQIIQDTKNSSCDVIWQLGNEPNSYHHHLYPINMTGARMAGDYQDLRGLVLQEETFLSRVLWELSLADVRVSIVGPDVTEPKPNGLLRENSLEFLEQFLSTPGVVDAVSWHQYSLKGADATLQQFLSPRVMEELRGQSRAVVALRDRHAKGRPVWLTETGSATGGGAPGLSNTFAACFVWLDKLGVAAQEGVALVARQALFGGAYAMFAQDLTPNPDYWVSVLHKRLVGQQVLNVTLEGAPPTARVYAHCLKGVPGRAVVFGVNVGEEAVPLAVTLAAGEPTGTTEPFEAYILTPTSGQLTDRSIALNGVPLVPSADGGLPPLPPRLNPALVMPPHALGFWVVPAHNVSACLDE